MCWATYLATLKHLCYISLPVNFSVLLLQFLARLKEKRSFFFNLLGRMVTTVITSLQPNGTYCWWRVKKGQMRSDPAWPAYEHMNRRVRRRGAVFFISQRTGNEGPGNAGDSEETTLNQMAVCQQQSESVSELLTCFLFQPEGAAVRFPGTWLGPGDPNAEPCKKRLTFPSKCVTRKKGHFQGHLATEPGACWSPWPQGVTCRSDVNRRKEQSLGLAILLMELGLQITLKTH